jgi:8-hydroxy-5-deazaflavin:NADPH oxidoreductase
MSDLTVIGTGNMGTAITAIAERGGRTVQSVGHADAGSAIEGDIVVLAVPYPAMADVIATYGDQLAGRIVVDITNPVDFTTFDSLAVTADSSAAADISTQLPGSTVLKAFNTTFAATLATGSTGDQPTTVLIAGDFAVV